MYPNYGNKPSFMTNPSNTAFGASASSFRQPNTSVFSSMQSSDIFQSSNPINASPFNAGISNQASFATNIFGQQQQSAFSNNSAFGQNKNSFGFGFTAGQNGLFGQQPQQTGSSCFQSNITNLLSKNNVFNTQGQTDTDIKFSPVIGTDILQKSGMTQSIRTKIHCIVCMKEYENKSLEELRFEDYSCNKKGPQQKTVFSSSPFGSNSIVSSNSSFGQTNSKQNFVQAPSVAQTSTFGQFNPGFGTIHENNTPSLFGKSNFATTTNTATFGFNSASNPFDSSQTPKSLYQPLLGTTTTRSQTGFGAGVFAPTNIQSNSNNMYQKLGQPATSLSMGAGLPAFCFNQTGTTSTSNIFSVLKPTTSSGIFQNMNIGATGYRQTSQPTVGTSFGKITSPIIQSTQPTFSTNFNSPLQQQTFPSISKPNVSFGNTTVGSSLFNNNVVSQAPITLSHNNMIQQQPIQFPPEPPDDVKNISLIASDSFPDGPHSYGLEPIFGETNFNTTNFQLRKPMPDYSKKKDEFLRAKIKMYLPKPKRGSIKEFFDINTTLKTSHKCLVIRKVKENPSTIFDKYKNDLIEDVKECLKRQNGDKEAASAVASSGGITSEDDCQGEKMPNKNYEEHKKLLSTETPDSTKREKSFTFNESSSFMPLVASSETNFDTDNVILNEENLASSEGEVDRYCHLENIDNLAGVILTRPEYFMYPDLKDLHHYMNENGECIVQGLTIGRIGYGNVYFPDCINIADMNFDELVHFRHREIIIYPDDSTKPPVGEGLNRRAQVTLDKIFPRKKGTKSYITDVNQIINSNFVDNLIHVTQKHDCKFVDYRPKTGSWVFKVKHFSTYTIAAKNLEVMVSK